MRDMEGDRTAHVLEAADAQRTYKESMAGAHDEYCQMVGAWEGLLLVLCDVEGEDAAEHVTAFLEVVEAYIFKVSSDYQMDKQSPAWHGTRVQPGPTYFLSKLTNYAHIICAESLGECTGESRFGRNIAYLREEPVGGAKDANDTVSTFLDFLLGRSSPVCEQPKLHRTGYDESGPILGAERTTEATSRTCTVGVASSAWAGVAPEGFTVVKGFPFDE